MNPAFHIMVKSFTVLIAVEVLEQDGRKESRIY